MPDDPLVPFHFDSTLGFPGEGWALIRCLWISLTYGFRCLLRWLVLFPVWFLSVLFAVSSGAGRPVGLLLLCYVAACPAMAMPLFPQTAGERIKADTRRLQGPIPMGRPVLPATGSNREKLLNVFLLWAGEEGIDFRWMLDHHYE